MTAIGRGIRLAGTMARVRLTLPTERLVLRPLLLADAPRIKQLASDREVADGVLHIPHPYPRGVAEKWVARCQRKAKKGIGATFAVVPKYDTATIGVMELTINPVHQHAELGYWLGKPYWGQGYCTEAAQAVTHFGFTTLGLNRMYANHFKRNHASGRVLEKIGMQCEGCSRQHFKKNNIFEDSVRYGLLREDFMRQHSLV